MLIQKITLKNFRRHQDLSLDFEPGVTVILGPNGSGKTSILEAIYYFVSSLSFKTRRDREVINWNTDQALIKGLFHQEQAGLIPLKALFSKQTQSTVKQLFFHDNPITHLKDILIHVIAGLFTPSDLHIVQGDPQTRRRFMDLLLCKLNPSMLGLLHQYQQALKQKNSLLRSQQSLQLIQPWNIVLSKLGAQISKARHHLINTLLPEFKAIHTKLDPKTTPHLSLKTSLLDEEQLLEKFTTSYPQELNQGSTLWGPHRNDFKVELESRSAKTYASQGQHRTLALALKLAEAAVLHQELGHTPIMLLDDSFSELDPAHQEALVETLQPYQQAIITSAYPLSSTLGQQVREIELS